MRICTDMQVNLLVFYNWSRNVLRIPDSYDAKIAKVYNLWMFWPVIQLINHLLINRQLFFYRLWAKRPRWIEHCIVYRPWGVSSIHGHHPCPFQENQENSRIPFKKIMKTLQDILDFLDTGILNFPDMLISLIFLKPTGVMTIDRLEAFFCMQFSAVGH